MSISSFVYDLRDFFFVFEELKIMDSPSISPKTITDLSLEQLKIGLGGRLSPRRLGCVTNKYDLLKYLWKESQIDDHILEKYKTRNIDEISQNDDAFSRYLKDNRKDLYYTGQNEYGEFTMYV